MTVKTKRKRVNDSKVLHNAIKEDAPLLSNEDKFAIREAVCNASLDRRTMMANLLDPRRDIDKECGYPAIITTEQFKKMYDREGMARRVVEIFPEETWAMNPEVVENEESELTDFEQAFVDLDKKHQLWSTLARVDEMSGIGRYGILLIGLDDGADMSKPVEGVDDDGTGKQTQERKLIYLRPLDESALKIRDTEPNTASPRFGQPRMYEITLSGDIAQRSGDAGDVKYTASQSLLVHWSRVLHVADNRKSSEVFGIPRMQALYNRLYDIRKIAGGSGEMFYKGGFPGYAFEMDANALPMDTVSKAAVRQEIADYSNGLQRYMVTQGLSAKSLNPQVANPKFHIDVQLEQIAITLGVPKRIFMGSEQAKLASSQDSKSWNKRLAKRQTNYVSPYLIRPFIDRLIQMGVLPEVEDYEIEWPDLDAPSDLDKAEVLNVNMQAFAKYVGGGVDALIPPESFLKMFVGMKPEEIDEISKLALEREQLIEGKSDVQDVKDVDKAGATAAAVAKAQAPDGKQENE